MKKIFLIPVFCLFAVACNTGFVYHQQENKVINDEVYADDADRYRQNIAVKEKGEKHVTYEYKDVRIDELAPLAIKYCEENVKDTQAYLREIVLYRNNLRRATFDCVNLAIDK